MIVIDTLGIDIILGMETLTKWGTKIYCASRTLGFTTPDGQKIEVSVPMSMGSIHQMEARPADGI